MFDKNCIFCKIINGVIPCYKVYETDSVLAFLDIVPISYGHTIVIPKKHYYNFLDMPENDMKSFFQDLKRITIIVKEKLEIDGLNIVQNNFPAAGQVIPHLHFHIIPRMNGDDPTNMIQSKTQAKDKDLKNILEKMLK